ncbi:M50 family metallopeptidase [Qipengyuania sp. MTN3-11]|uniref:M50 family metallopeptidase n=1 Tax=Qipengyuania sp. MTN3-11 TaxID=3056557 RepID=UPI0036F25DCA
MAKVPRPSTQSEQVGRLIIAAALVLFLPQLPLGNYLLYPFAILTTWFHEMGHGVAAMAAGWEFERLILLPDGSGIAESHSYGEPGRLSQALVGAGGPLGPVVVGALLILASARHRLWRPALYTLAGAILLSVLIWVRSATGLIVLPLVAAGIGAIAWRGRDGFARFALQFLGVLAGLSMLRDWHYLFSESAIIGGRPMLSDTGAIEQALFLPHWFWAIAITALSALILGSSLKYALREEGSAVSQAPADHEAKFWQ